MKTLSLPLSALLVSLTMPVKGDIALQLSSNADYRQDKKGRVNFRGADFNVFLRDGDGVYVGGCDAPFYYPPNISLVCPGGSTGYVIFGSPDVTAPGGPYYWFTDVIPGIVVEPRLPNLCILEAAPASKLPRPSGGFKDISYGVYYNLHTPASVIESIITRYDMSRNYTAQQESKFFDEVVPGVYHYSFPRLGAPVLKVPISPVIYPMPEGYRTINSQKVGVKYKAFDRFNWQGFMELSYQKPNVIKWSGFSPTVVYPAVDSLYFSLRYLSNPSNPNSNAKYTAVVFNPLTLQNEVQPVSIFPDFVSGGDPKILLGNPFVDSFTIPPIFPSGTRGLIELELDRNFQTGGVTYDYSTRRFQMPFVIVNRYSDYSELRFPPKKKKGTGILEDYDGDGYNNLTEWILESRADDDTSIPVAPVAEDHAEVVDAVTGQVTSPAYFGFTVTKQRYTRPSVAYTLQRSTNGGKTWKKFVSDNNWLVRVNASRIRVESLVIDRTDPFNPIPLQPPGTANHLYRVKITLKK